MGRMLVGLAGSIDDLTAHDGTEGNEPSALPGCAGPV